MNVDDFRVISLKPQQKILVNGLSVQFDEDEAEIRDESETVIAVIKKTSKPEELVMVELPEHGFDVVHTSASFIVNVSFITNSLIFTSSTAHDSVHCF